MLPLFIDVSRMRLVLVGSGQAAARRLDLLEAAGAGEIEIFAPNPSSELELAAGPRLQRRLPSLDELAAAHLIFIADLGEPDRSTLAATARTLGVITHVEDAPTLSDAQSPAVVRRGALTLAVSTGGASPSLATQLRDFLGRLFGPEWGGRLDEISRLRRAWRQAGHPPDEIADMTGEWVNRRNWLPTQTRH